MRKRPVLHFSALLAVCISLRVQASPEDLTRALGEWHSYLDAAQAVVCQPQSNDWETLGRDTIAEITGRAIESVATTEPTKLTHDQGSFVSTRFRFELPRPSRIDFTRYYDAKHRLMKTVVNLDEPPKGWALSVVLYFRAEFTPDCRLAEIEIRDFNDRGKLEQRRWVNGEGKTTRTVYAKRRVKSLEAIYTHSTPTGGAPPRAVEEALAIAQRTDRVLVTVLDCGVDYNHPELAYKVLRPREGAGAPPFKEGLIRELDTFLLVEEELSRAASEEKQRRQKLEAARARAERASTQIRLQEEETRTEMAALSEVSRWWHRASYEKELATLDHRLNVQRARVTEAEEAWQKIVQRKKLLSEALSDQTRRIRALGRGWNFEADDDEPYDYEDSLFSGWSGFNHGTHVAGILTRDTDDIVILPLRPGKGESHYYLEAITYAYLLGSRIVNLSMGTEYPEDWADFETAVRKYPDMLFVVAAGNESDNLEMKPHYPAALGLSNILVVASVSTKGELSEFSNYSAKLVDIAAPGEDITSLAPEGLTAIKSGTSMATPAVSRVAALIKLAAPALGPREIIAIIGESADHRDLLQGKLRVPGVINPERALGLARRQRRAPPTSMAAATPPASP